MDEQGFMHMAIDIAVSEVANPARSPVGYVIVRDGKVVSVMKNGVERLRDATAHAEMLAIREDGMGFDAGDLRRATV